MAPIVEKYPAFAVQFADHFIATKGKPDTQFVALLQARFNVPKDVFPFLYSGGGGGRSAESIANAVRNYSVTIFNRSKTLGLNLKPEEVSYIAQVAEKQNFTMEQVDDALRGLIRWDQLGAGTLTSNRDSLNATARSYLVSLPKETLTDWATRIATNQGTKEGFESVIREQAKLSNPWMSDYIDRGLNPLELLAPARRTIAQSFGIDEASIDFADSSFMKLVTVKDEKGNQRLANLSELRNNIRQDSRWASSDEAAQLSASMARLVSQVFGRSVF